MTCFIQPFGDDCGISKASISMNIEMPMIPFWDLPETREFWVSNEKSLLFELCRQVALFEWE